MRLSNRLEIQLNRLFLMSAALGLFVLLFSTYISTVQIKEKALNFIASHVKQIAVAEINSQNVSDIDREVRRVYEGWQDTQDIDIRIEVFLDGKLVGKAGQLQPFGSFSTLTNQTYNLPSGQELLINVDLNLSKQIYLDLVFLVIFGIFLAGCFWLLRKNLRKVIKEISNPLEERINWLTTTANNLPDSLKKGYPLQSTQINELDALDASLGIFAKQILNLEEKIKEAGIKEGRVKMAEQLAHNIKGKLATLKLSINNSKGLSIKESNKLLSAVNDVSSAAQNLLKARREGLAVSNLSVVNIVELLEKVVEQTQLPIELDRIIKIDFKKNVNKLPAVLADAAELEAVFSNIIDNSIDAIKGNGSIVISVNTHKDTVAISISDTGCGIAPEILPQLMQEGKSFGKKDGNGLGLFHARNTVENLKGNILISSVLNGGTSLFIELPIVKSEKTNPFTISLRSNQTLVILDDDKLIHASVDLLLKNCPETKVVHLYSIEEFEKWMNENGAGELGSRVYWMDYDLKHKEKSGISMIQKFGLELEAFLITGMANDAEIKNMAQSLQIRILSKDYIPWIRFENEQKNRVQEIGLQS